MINNRIQFFETSKPYFVFVVISFDFYNTKLFGLFGFLSFLILYIRFTNNIDQKQLCNFYSF